MIKVQGFYSRYTVDVTGFTKTTDGIMEIQMRQAAREWLRAVIVKVPVWTGMSRGSLKPLGAFLRVKVPISPVASRKGMGIAAGEKKSSFEFTKENGRYIFRFEENVAHYTVNEYYNANVSSPEVANPDKGKIGGTGLNLKNPGPYGSFKAGGKAWQRYIDANLADKLPKVADFVTRRRTRKVGN